MTGVVYHPSERNLLYARTDVGGAYRWDVDHGAWIALNDDIGRDRAELHGVLAIGLDPNDANRVYLACGSYTPSWAAFAAVLVSNDRGVTWQRHDVPFKLGGNENGRSTGERLQVDPRDGSRLLLGTNHDGLWRSDDRAAKWHRIEGFPASSVTFVLFAHAPGAARNEIYAGGGSTREPALYRSTDGGTTWTAVPGQPPGLIVHHAVCDANGVLYLAYANGLGPNDVTTGAVWKFEPGVERWTNISPLVPNPETKDNFGYAGIDLDRTRPGTIVVSTLDRWKFRDEIFRTTDGGRTWQPLLADATWDHAGAAYVEAMKPHWTGAVSVDPFDGRRAWFITGYGVWATRSLDAPDARQRPSWVFADRDLEETVIDDLVSPPSGAPLVSAIGDLGGFRHEELDRSPGAGMHRPFHGTGASIAVASARPTIFVRTHSGPTRGAISRDGGASWQDFSSVPAPAVQQGSGAITIGCDARTLVWLPKGAPPYFSRDDGATWTRSESTIVASAGFLVDRPAADAGDGNTFYVYEQLAGRVHVSTDGGAHFTLASLMPTRGGALQPEPGAAGTVWLPTAAGLYVSRDGARSFTRCATMDAATHVAFGCPARPGQPQTMFAAGTIRGRTALYRSDDRGGNWIPVSDDRLRFGWIRTLAADPRVYGRVYVGTSGRGIFYGEIARPGEARPSTR